MRRGCWCGLAGPAIGDGLPPKRRRLARQRRPLACQDREIAVEDVVDLGPVRQRRDDQAAGRRRTIRAPATIAVALNPRMIEDGSGTVAPMIVTVPEVLV